MGTIPKTETKRNNRLYKLRKKGKSFGELALIFNISRARAKQIFDKKEKRLKAGTNG